MRLYQGALQPTTEREGRSGPSILTLAVICAAFTLGLLLGALTTERTMNHARHQAQETAPAHAD